MLREKKLTVAIDFFFRMQLRELAPQVVSAGRILLTNPDNEVGHSTHQCKCFNCMIDIIYEKIELKAS